MLLTDSQAIRDVLLFPTMKSMGAAKNEANNAAQSAPVEKTVEKAIAEVKETYDFSNVEVEPLFKDMVDFDTFSKSDFRAVKVKEWGDLFCDRSRRILDRDHPHPIKVHKGKPPR